MKSETTQTTSKIFTIPNILSFLRIALIPWIIWLYLKKQDYLKAGLVLILSGITDVVDGFIARRFQMTSNVGKVLDPVADKLTQTAMLVCLTIRFPFMLIPLCLVVVKETFMTITGALVVYKKRIVHGANWHGKLATFLLDGLVVLHVFWYNIPGTLSLVLIIISSVMIAVSFVLYGIRNIRSLRRCGF